ncbi:MAG TPA: transcription-repair coupling factor [Pyrinomonadaceae bacterium]|nr:transcription-repair coupling factor [Pyrinomonadaceae bacterium]
MAQSNSTVRERPGTARLLCGYVRFMDARLNTLPEIDRLIAELKKGSRTVSISGLTSISAKAYVLSRVQAATGTHFAIITQDNEDIETWSCDLDFWDAASLTLPSFDTDVYSGISPHAETQERRALALWRMTRELPGILVLSARSLITRTFEPHEVAELGSVIARDADFPPETLVQKLVAAGYVREEPIGNIGQFSIRGGIIDVWSPEAENPVRIEFFGDTVDSIREFDPDTQLSTGQLPEAGFAPMREFSATEQDMKDWAFFASDRFSDERFLRNLRDRTDFAKEGETFSGWEFLIGLTKPPGGTIFDYLRDSVLVIDEPQLVEQTLSTFYENTRERFEQTIAAEDIALEPKELFLTAEELRAKLGSMRRAELRALGRTAATTDEEFAVPSSALADGSVSPALAGEPVSESTHEEIESRPSANSAGADVFRSRRASAPPLFLFSAVEKSTELEILSRSTRKFHGDLPAFADDLKKQSLVPTLAMETLGLAERIEEILREYEASIPPGAIKVGKLSGGFEIPSAQLEVFTETDIFGEVQHAESSTPSRARRTRSKLGAFISDFRDLKSGDYVVHVDHGIGRFEALQTIEAGGMSREFMLLIYAEDSKLFVPVERMDLVSRYSSGEATSPTLDRLGGLGWQKTKAKAKRAMRDMADELLRLYAERKLVQGYAFSSDTPWQQEFEDAFPYDLTVDQASAIEEVKEDMETARPMDRLIIGDVGYGKTEVAMRAAFKAVMDGKQVAILSPTTILAYQHYESFCKRFAAFPAKIDLLSRFRSSKEQKAVVEQAEKANVDVLIGTHRVLSNDVKLPKLGLVVVDEEQRFGVAHKEKLKQLKKKVDVLTLSATPIPRTLNMSLLGMRDMSVIETPPRDRLAINTQVVQFSEGVIRSAVELELARNGQIFFIHNRVETIEAIAALIQKIVPNARVAIGHGKMNEKEMEQVMLDFIDYKYDILVATTIIENGIDIPRANTIIINRADNYGLSQLYQLRGRVGRSNRRAYAYLLIPSELELTPIARRRLSAIREFSDLGAGFRIAALDLELRGAGNILGGQQSGHLDALGFDLYTKMLERTIAEMRGDEIADETSVAINLGVDVSIPHEYISEASQRLRTYKRISSAESDEALMHIHAEIEDRYGRIPESVENLFAYGRLRKLAEQMLIVSIDKTAGGVAIKLSENAKVNPEKLMGYLSRNEQASFSPSGILRVAAEDDGPISAARRALEDVRA